MKSWTSKRDTVSCFTSLPVLIYCPVPSVYRCSTDLLGSSTLQTIMRCLPHCPTSMIPTSIRVQLHWRMTRLTRRYGLPLRTRMTHRCRRAQYVHGLLDSSSPLLCLVSTSSSSSAIRLSPSVTYVFFSFAVCLYLLVCPCLR